MQHSEKKQICNQRAEPMNLNSCPLTGLAVSFPNAFSVIISDSMTVRFVTKART